MIYRTKENMDQGQLELRQLIDDHFLYIHDQLTATWLNSEKRNQPAYLAAFNTRHAANWQAHDQALLEAGLAWEHDAL